MKRIRVAEYTVNPGLRHIEISEKSGEDFYHKILNNAFAEAYSASNKLIIDLDGTRGYAPSFIDEAFGNLVYDFTLKIVKDHLEIISNDETHWIKMIEDETYKDWEARRIAGKYPKVTGDHEEWFRLNNDLKLEKRIWK